MSVKTLKIDGIDVAAEEGTSVLKAAEEAGLRRPARSFFCDVRERHLRQHGRCGRAQLGHDPAETRVVRGLRSAALFAAIVTGQRRIHRRRV